MHIIWVNNYDPVIPANPVLHSILKSGILRNVFTLGTLIIQLKQYQVTVVWLNMLHP